VKKNLRIVLGGVVVLVAAVVGIHAAGERSREAAERNGVLAGRQRSVVGQVDIGVLLIGAPAQAFGLQIVAQGCGGGVN
jgi:hypothetical protein